MPEPIIVVGAGGFGREAIDVIRALGSAYELLGVVDGGPSAVNLERLDALGVDYLGTEDDWLASGRTASYVVGIGSPRVRALVAARLDAVGMTAAVIVHPRAGVGSAATIGAGSVICAGSQVSTNVTLGKHVHLNPNSTVGHDTVIGDFVSLNPGSIVSGDCVIGPGTLVGAGAVVLQQLTVGESSVIGAAACLTRDLGPGLTVVGVPARPVAEEKS